MNPLQLILPLLMQGVQQAGGAAAQKDASASDNSALIAALIAVLAGQSQQQTTAASAPSSVPLPKVVSILAVCLPIAMFIVMIALAVILALGGKIGEHQEAIVSGLQISLGALIALTGAAVNYWFGSSIGSWHKNFLLQGATAGGQNGAARPLPIPQPEPHPEPTPVTLPIETPHPPAIPGIGPSTDPSTKDKRMDTALEKDTSGKLIPASIRYNNPGAQWPSADAARFGQIGYGQLGDAQGNKIARFPHPVNGAASNLDLLRRNYVGMEIGAAGKKWTGANSFGVPGYSDSALLTAQMIDDPSSAIPFMKAIAKREAGRDSPLTEQEWAAAHAMFKAGSADAYLGVSQSKLPTGAEILARAKLHIGEKYVLGARAPKDDAGYKGPWDCAEFASWLVYQVAGILYGCTDDSASPDEADAYTGAWKTDANTKGRMVSVSEAAGTPGAFLLRYPASAGATGHIVVSDGLGGTVEAASTNLGVIAGKVAGRHWDTGVEPIGIDYSGAALAVHGPVKLYALGQPNMDAATVRAIQEALVAKGFNPGEIDGEFGVDTSRAVGVFQAANGLIIDNEVGPETAAALGVIL
jgi:Putative peptidoglycan binding domain